MGNQCKTSHLKAPIFSTSKNLSLQHFGFWICIFISISDEPCNRLRPTVDYKSGGGTFGSCRRQAVFVLLPNIACCFFRQLLLLAYLSFPIVVSTFQQYCSNLSQNIAMSSHRGYIISTMMTKYKMLLPKIPLVITMIIIAMEIFHHNHECELLEV